MLVTSSTEQCDQEHRGSRSPPTFQRRHRHHTTAQPTPAQCLLLAPTQTLPFLLTLATNIGLAPDFPNFSFFLVRIRPKIWPRGAGKVVLTAHPLGTPAHRSARGVNLGTRSGEPAASVPPCNSVGSKRDAAGAGPWASASSHTSSRMATVYLLTRLTLSLSPKATPRSSLILMLDMRSLPI